MPQQGDLESRVAQLEGLVRLVLTKARRNPVGRKVVETLGIDGECPRCDLPIHMSAGCWLCRWPL